MTMIPSDMVGLLLGAVALGAVHGVEPGHGWPVAASYALDQTNKWLYGLIAGLIIGIGHLVSSLTMVGVFFYAKSYFSLTQVNEPLTVLSGVQIGGPVSVVAGVLLIGLGVREYRHDHSHGSHEGDHTHSHERRDHESTSHANHGDSHDDVHVHPDAQDGEEIGSRLRRIVPFVGGHSHTDGGSSEIAERGLFGIAWFAFLLGFAHEEEFEIIALCAGSSYCLELMSVYASTVIVGIVGLTMLLVAGYQRHEETVTKYTPYLPAFSAAILILMGGGFILGVF
jgi:ABC-type nickel/cobalt efflux system permease component RcnA